MSETRVDCIAWQKNYYNGKFVEWIRVGKGYILMRDGKPVKAHTRDQSTVRGDSVNTILLPVGEAPPQSELQPKRRDGLDTAEDDFSE